MKMANPRRLRRTMEAKIGSNAALKQIYTDAVMAHIDEAQSLQQVLQPAISIDEQACDTGDSFLRMMLNVTALQPDLAQRLLERLPELADAVASAEILVTQFRW